MYGCWIITIWIWWERICSPGADKLLKYSVVWNEWTSMTFELDKNKINPLPATETDWRVFPHPIKNNKQKQQQTLRERVPAYSLPSFTYSIPSTLHSFNFFPFFLILFSPFRTACSLLYSLLSALLSSQPPKSHSFIRSKPTKGNKQTK